eukprot:jgi/Astpho2/2674/fgenesh1_pm.00049_%23_16_t
MEQLQQGLIEQHLLQVAKNVEDQLDSQLHQLDNLREDDVEQLRQKRIQQLKRQADRKREWLSKGHGEYREILSEKDFFAEMKGTERMVCHFYRENWPCKVMDKHLSILAQQHTETKFVKIHAEKSPYLTEKLRIFMLPTLALVKNQKVDSYIVGFDELGGKDDFSTEVLAARLEQAGLLWPSGGLDGVALQHKTSEVPRRSIRQRGRDSDDEDSDFD